MALPPDQTGDQPPKPNFAARLVQLLRGTVSSLWNVIAVPSVLAIVIVSAIALWSGLRHGADVSADYMPKRWNDSIQRLGITPVYPPQEDIYVGDLIIQVVESGHQFREKPKYQSHDSEAFIGKYIKIGQVKNVRQYLGIASFAPDLGDSVWVENKLALKQPSEEADGDLGTAGKVRLTDVLFPVIKVQHNDGFLGVLDWFSLGIASAASETIELKHVQTYSMHPLHAYGALLQTCADMSDYCEDGFVRDILSYTLSQDILLEACTINGKLRPIYDMKLLLVRQVFTARGVEVLNGRGMETSVATSRKEPSDTAGELRKQGENAASAADDATHDAPVDATPATVAVVPAEGSSAFRRTSSSGLFTTGSFARPLVIGFNAVSVGMRNSRPAWIEENIEKKNTTEQQEHTSKEESACQ